MPSAAKAGLLAAGVFAVYLVVSTLGNLGWDGPICEMPVAVEVLNGCGEPGIADRVASHLRDCGFDVMYVGNAGDFKFSETIVVDRTGDHEKTHAVAGALGRPPVIHQVGTAFFVDVTVVLGKDIGTSSTLLGTAANAL